MFPMKVMSLALWDKALTAKQVKGIYNAIKGMKMSDKAEEKKKKQYIPKKDIHITTQANVNKPLNTL